VRWTRSPLRDSHTGFLSSPCLRHHRDFRAAAMGPQLICVHGEFKRILGTQGAVLGDLDTSVDQAEEREREAPVRHQPYRERESEDVRIREGQRVRLLEAADMCVRGEADRVDSYARLHQPGPGKRGSRMDVPLQRRRQRASRQGEREGHCPAPSSLRPSTRTTWSAGHCPDSPAGSRIYCEVRLRSHSWV
jgi:hypothetical protein